MASEVQFKRCALCKRLRDRVNFYKSRNKRASSDGLQGYCCDCSTGARRRNLNRSDRIAPVHPASFRKLCTGCLTWKPAKEFYLCANTADGLQHRCKECDAASALARYHKKRRREAANA